MIVIHGGGDHDCVYRDDVHRDCVDREFFLS